MQWFAKKRHGINVWYHYLITLESKLGIRKESESISRIEIDKIQMIPNPIDTGLVSIGPLTKKLLQKHRPVSYSKNRRKRALSQRSLTESSTENDENMLRTKRALLAWCTLRRFVRASAYYIERKLWKRRLWNMISFALLAVTLFRFFLGKSIWSYCRLSLNVSRILKSTPTWPCSLSSICLTRMHAPFAILNLTQPVRTDL